MYVKLCFKTATTPKGKIKFIETKGVREAMKIFKEKGHLMTEAYISRFEGYHWYVHKRLKGGNDGKTH